MKTFILFALLFVSSLMAIWVQGEEEAYGRIRVWPIEKKFESDSTVELMDKHRRSARSIRRPNACPIPKTLDDSQLDCKLYPSRIECIQTCMFGHTLRDGIQRRMSCRYDENRWSPTTTFEKCHPFVDCTLTIGPGGKYKCYTNFMDKGNVCDVSCEKYEDRPAVPKKSYQCDINGKWSPELPFCARPGTGIRLVSPPNGPKTASGN